MKLWKISPSLILLLALLGNLAATKPLDDEKEREVRSIRDLVRRLDLRAEPGQDYEGEDYEQEEESERDPEPIPVARLNGQNLDKQDLDEAAKLLARDLADKIKEDHQGWGQADQMKEDRQGWGQADQMKEDHQGWGQADRQAGWGQERPAARIRGDSLRRLQAPPDPARTRFEIWPHGPHDQSSDEGTQEEDPIRK